MTPRTARLIFLVGLSVGIASWMVERTVYEQYADRDGVVKAIIEMP